MAVPERAVGREACGGWLIEIKREVRVGGGRTGGGGRERLADQVVGVGELGDGRWMRLDGSLHDVLIWDNGHH